MRFTWLGLVALLAACGGGGGASGTQTAPTIPVVPATVAAFATATPAATGATSVPVVTYNGPTATVAAVGTVPGGAVAPAAAARARGVFSLRQLKSVSSVSISGTIASTTVQAPAVSANQSVTATNGSVSIGLTFSNVPVANNAIMTVRLTAVAPDGSTYPLGVLCALVNVSSTTVNSTTLSLATTQRCFVAATLQQQGLLNADDWTDPTLDTRLAGYITSAGIAPDPTYQIFSAASLQTLVTNSAKSLARTLTITTSPALPNAYVAITFDPSLSPVDAIVTAATQNVFYAFSGLVPYVAPSSYSSSYYSSSNYGQPAGSPVCFTNVPPLAGNSVSLPPVSSGYCYYPTVVRLGPTGTVTAPVYGRGMRLTIAAPAASPYPSPSPVPSPLSTPVPYASPTPLAGAATAAPIVTAGTTGTVAVAIGTAQQTVTVTDPLAAGFGISNFVDYSVSDVPQSTLLNSSPYGVSYNNNFQYAGMSGSSLLFQVGTLNPFDPAGSTKFCGGPIPQCVALTGTGGTLSVVRPYRDPGSNLGVFNYTPSGFFGKPTQVANGNGYTIPVTTYLAGATGTLTTTTPTNLLGGYSGSMSLSVYAYSLPTSCTLQVQATTPSGLMSSSTSLASTSSWSVTFSSLSSTQPTSVSQLQFVFTCATASATASSLSFYSASTYPQ